MSEESRNENIELEPSIQTTEKTVIYLGPTIKGTILRHFVIFMDGVPEKYANHEIYKHLFVPVEKLDESLEALKRKGTKLNIFYEKAKRGDK